ncbi:ATP-grasp domain-containing protein [Enterococcus plantarum]|uniref:ATP-grasp domain-containing protein n=1 Tax=Enterococcus plantarum TaxID=1077675 RepID=UPI001A8F615A|nr:hypothetical protein [Enterococcus plantarum]MBO0422168.1 hypothetical protein [Enterococcus plantarum]
MHILVLNSDKTKIIDKLADINGKSNIKISILGKEEYRSLYDASYFSFYGISSYFDIKLLKQKFLQIEQEQKIDKIIATTEKSLFAAGFLRSYFGIVGSSITIGLATSNKLTMKNLLKQHIKIGDFFSIANVEELTYIVETSDYPIIVKPAVGSGTKKTIKLEKSFDPENPEIKELFFNQEPVIAEEFIKIQNEYHCDAVISNGKIVFQSISRYFSPLLGHLGELNGSVILNSESKEVDEILKILKEIIKQLHMENEVIHLETYTDQMGEMYFGEITTRIGGAGVQETIHQKYGVSLSSCIFGDLETIKNKQEVSGFFAWVGLPGENGTIQKLTIPTKNENMSIIKVENFYHVGDKMEGEPSSIFFSAIVYLQCKTLKELQKTLEYIQNYYEIEAV